MRMSRSYSIVPLAAAILMGPASLRAQQLKCVTVNAWSGVDYRGFCSVGEYESPEVRSGRVDALVSELSTVKPDLVALQELNDVFDLAPKLADALGYDYVSQRGNSGIKIWRVGIPWNLNEGMAILAREDLHLEFVDVWDLSETFGAVGNAFSLHFEDQNLALVARIVVAGQQIYVVNIHLSSAVPDIEASWKVLRLILDQEGAPEATTNKWLERLRENAALRQEECERLAERIHDQLGSAPVMLMGDFNATPFSPEINSLVKQGFIDSFEAAGNFTSVTWDPAVNPNIKFSINPATQAGDTLDPLARLSALYDRYPRRIDYVLLGPGFSASDVRSARVILKEPQNGIYASDHYGVLAEIDCSRLVKSLSGHPLAIIPSPEAGIDVLPIITYDTDVGFGYGVKAFFLNYLDWSESFDLVAFNSTKGERWYRFVFSVPDFELRQGKRYPISFDLTIDYDTYLKNNFFGIGGLSRKESRETYRKEPLDIWGIFSRGFSREFVAQLGVKFRTVRNLDYADTSLFALTLPPVNHRRSSAVTFFASVRYDSRDSYINPSRGKVAQLDLEVGRKGFLSDYGLASATVALQTYQTLFYPKTVFAARLLAQVSTGANLPVHSYVSLGGNKTLRGFPQDRFLGKLGLVANAELRFPIIWRFDGICFLDAGRLWHEVSEAQLFRGAWHSDVGVGLRFLMDTFIVRADLGFSREGAGFYFNFGHVF